MPPALAEQLVPVEMTAASCLPGCICKAFAQVTIPALLGYITQGVLQLCYYRHNKKVAPLQDCHLVLRPYRALVD